MTPQERDMVIRTIVSESGGEEPLGQTAVASVILNRLKSGEYGKTAIDVVTAPNQFEGGQPAVSKKTPAYKQAALALQEAEAGNDPTGGAVNFLNPELQESLGREQPSWASPDRNPHRIGGHVFYGGSLAAGDVEDDELFNILGIEPVATGGEDMADDELLELLGIAKPTEQPGKPEEAGQAGGDGPTGEKVGFGAGVARGFEDVAATGADLIGWGVTEGADILADWGAISPETAAAVREHEARRDAIVTGRREEFEQAPGDVAFEANIPFMGKVAPRVADLGRLTGQVAATAGPVGAVTRAGGAGLTALSKLPGFTKPAAFLGGQGGKRAATKAVSRAIPGAGVGATAAGSVSSGYDVPLNEQLLAGGALGGLIAPVAPAVARAAGTAWQRLFGRRGTTPAAMDDVLQQLDDAGLTPEQAKAMIRVRGDDTMIADLSPGMSNQAGSLAASGGKATERLKGSVGERAAAADVRMAEDINRILGPKPDITQTVEQITTAAGQRYGQLKRLAMRQNQPVTGIKTVVRQIDKLARNAVGREKALLQQVKGWLVDSGVSKTASQGQPKPVTVYKSDLDAVLKVRQSIDDLLETSYGKDLNSAGKNARRSLQQVRDRLDKQLKKNDFIKQADKEFSGEMAIQRGVETGQDFFARKLPFEDAERLFNNASFDVQNAIRLGARHAIGEAIEQARGGEAGAARSMFGKGSAMQKKLRLLFGDTAADELTERIDDFVMKRHTETNVGGGSQTAARQALEKKRTATAEKFQRIIAGASGAALGFAAGGVHGVAPGYIGGRMLQKGAEKLASKSLARMEADVAKILATKGDDAIQLLEALQVHKARSLGSPNKLYDLAPSGAALAGNVPLELTVPVGHRLPGY